MVEEKKVPDVPAAETPARRTAEEKRVTDVPSAEMLVKRAMETRYGKNLKNVSFRKCWYSAAGQQEFMDVEGTVELKKGLMGKETRNFRYQIDPKTGNIIGYEDNILLK
jgi:hypothetical protein